MRLHLDDGWSIALDGEVQREDGRDDGVTLLWDRDLSIELQRAEGDIAEVAAPSAALGFDAEGVSANARLDRHAEIDGTFTAAVVGVARCGGSSVLVRIAFTRAAVRDRAIAVWRSLRRAAPAS